MWEWRLTPDRSLSFLNLCLSTFPCFVLKSSCPSWASAPSHQWCHVSRAEPTYLWGHPEAYLIWREARMVKSWASSTTQRRMISNLRTVNLKCYLAKLLARSKGKKLAVSKASVLECFTWTLEVSHHLTNTKSTFEILSNKSSPVKCLTCQNRNKQKLNQNHVNCSHPKNFSNISDDFSSFIACMISISSHQRSSGHLTHLGRDLTIVAFALQQPSVTWMNRIRTFHAWYP